jgi:hypothetical protein
MSATKKARSESTGAGSWSTSPTRPSKAIPASALQRALIFRDQVDLGIGDAGNAELIVAAVALPALAAGLAGAGAIVL